MAVSIVLDIKIDDGLSGRAVRNDMSSGKNMVENEITMLEKITIMNVYKKAMARNLLRRIVPISGRACTCAKNRQQP